MNPTLTLYDLPVLHIRHFLSLGLASSQTSPQSSNIFFVPQDVHFTCIASSLWSTRSSKESSPQAWQITGFTSILSSSEYRRSHSDISSAESPVQYLFVLSIIKRFSPNFPRIAIVRPIITTYSVKFQMITLILSPAVSGVNAIIEIINVRPNNITNNRTR